MRAEAEDGIEPSRAGVAIRRLPIWQLGHVEETGRVELPGLEARPFSKRVCKTGMHVVSAEESGGIEPLTVRSPRCSRPVTDQLVALSAAGCRGIEPRWPGLEPSLIPDRCPSSWRAGESNSARVACKASLHPGALPWRRASRGRLTRRARVRPSSGREESNFHDPGSRPGGQPLTHTQLSLSFPHHGSNVNPRNQRPRCCLLHHAGLGWTTRLELAWQTFTASGLDSSPSSTVLGTGFEPVFAASETAVLPVGRSESVASARRESNSHLPLIVRALCH